MRTAKLCGVGNVVDDNLDRAVFLLENFQRLAHRFSSISHVVTEATTHLADKSIHFGIPGSKLRFRAKNFQFLSTHRTDVVKFDHVVTLAFCRAKRKWELYLWVKAVE